MNFNWPWPSHCWELWWLMMLMVSLQECHCTLIHLSDLLPNYSHADSSGFTDGYSFYSHSLSPLTTYNPFTDVWCKLDTKIARAYRHCHFQLHWLLKLYCCTPKKKWCTFFFYSEIVSSFYNWLKVTHWINHEILKEEIVFSYELYFSNLCFIYNLFFTGYTKLYNFERHASIWKM